MRRAGRGASDAGSSEVRVFEFLTFLIFVSLGVMLLAGVVFVWRGRPVAAGGDPGPGRCGNGNYSSPKPSGSPKLP